MSFFKHKSSIPAPILVPPAPVPAAQPTSPVAEAIAPVTAAAAEETVAATKKRRGSQSTIATSPAGLLTEAPSLKKRLGD